MPDALISDQYFSTLICSLAAHLISLQLQFYQCLILKKKLHDLCPFMVIDIFASHRQIFQSLIDNGGLHEYPDLGRQKGESTDVYSRGVSSIFKLFIIFPKVPFKMLMVCCSSSFLFYSSFFLSFSNFYCRKYSSYPIDIAASLLASVSKPYLPEPSSILVVLYLSHQQLCSLYLRQHPTLLCIKYIMIIITFH